MGAREEFAGRVREIQTRRREREQELSRHVAEQQRKMEEWRRSLSHLDRDLEEEIARVRERFATLRTALGESLTGATQEIDRFRQEQEAARREADLAISGEALDVAGGGRRALASRQHALRQAAEGRRRRELVLASRPDLAQAFADYEQVARFRTSMEDGALPGPALQAIRGAVDRQLDDYRRRFRGEGVPFETDSMPAELDLLLLFDVSEVGEERMCTAHVITPCAYADYEQPDLAAPPLSLRVAAGVVRAVAEVQRAMCPGPAPVLYKAAGEALAVAGVLTGDVNATEAGQMLELEVSGSVSEIPDLKAANLRVELLALPPGVVQHLLGSREGGDGGH